ncbi:MAG: Fe-S cluster assembly ATPase SufC [Fidelibacterota bacterium]
MLEIKNLHAAIDGKPILKGINLTVKKGEMHAIMGRNGSGKSTLANILSGKEGYTISAGSITYEEQDLLALSTEERALRGIFQSFQYPVVIPGVNNTYFLRAAYNAKRKYLGQPELDAASFMKLIKEKIKTVGMDISYLKRSVNEGFSGGEKKRNEILQMITLEPKLAILDETDSGLDIDALQIVAEGVNGYRNPDHAFIVITHYQRLLKYIVPDVVHVLINGSIVKTGGPDLALSLEEKGYNWLDRNDD